MKRNIVLLIVSFILCCLVIGGIYFSDDRKKPQIKIKNEDFCLTCELTNKDILDNAEATDDNLKDFFIEESDISNILKSKKVTYVAVDSSNNVTKKQLPIKVDSKIYNYSIITKKDLVIDSKEDFYAGDYFALKNECGWDINATFTVENFNPKVVDDYNVIVHVNEYDVEPLEATFVVVDKHSPVITLKSESIEVYEGALFAPDYFERYIDNIEDDKDDYDYLKETLKIDSGSIVCNSSTPAKLGTYSIKYRVKDRDGNTGNATLTVSVIRNTYQEETGGE